ncbi:MAG: hypothetical protein V3R11_01935 [Nitrospirales bacterium]
MPKKLRRGSGRQGWPTQRLFGSEEELEIGKESSLKGLDHALLRETLASLEGADPDSAIENTFYSFGV